MVIFNSYKYKSSIIVILLIIIAKSAMAQGTAGYNAPFESREIIDMPTAGVLPKNSFNIKSKLYNEGGLALETNFSFLKNLMLGISFSGNNVIGNDNLQFQKIPGFNLKFRVFDETIKIPAIAVGFSNQGNGKWINSINRFENLSPGFYLALSKNFAWQLGEVSATGGIHYSFEPSKEDRCVNVYGGFEQTIWKYFSISGELNLNLDDIAYLEKKSPINFHLSLKSSIANGITIELQLRNIINSNKYIASGFERRLSIDIIRSF